MHTLRQKCFSTAVGLIRRSVGAVAARVPLSSGAVRPALPLGPGRRSPPRVAAVACRVDFRVACGVSCRVSVQLL